jgi:hypothetical protein|nr:MAG TPA: major tropism determinant [Bacteriophage sp.]
MAIQVRRGVKDDFDPTKMLPGEWAVSIDTDTNNQIVWMCFKAGVVKRMGTYEDFKAQIKDATKDIRDEYMEEFNVLLDQIESLAEETSTNANTVIQIKNDCVNTYLPQMQGYVNSALLSKNSALASATEAKSYAIGGTDSRAGEDIDNSKYYSEKSQASSQTAQAYATQAESASDEIVNRIDEAISQNVPQFTIDFTTGHLKYQGGRFDFSVNEAGHLLWEVTV